MTKVATIMSRDVVTAMGEDSLAAVMQKMLSRNISHVPVVDKDRRLIGIVAKTDVVSDRLFRGDGQEAETPTRQLKHGVRYTLDDGFHVDVAADVLVREVMTPTVLSVSDQATLREAAALMAANQVHGLAVLSKASGLVGFISTFDITTWVAKG